MPAKTPYQEGYDDGRSGVDYWWYDGPDKPEYMRGWQAGLDAAMQQEFPTLRS